MAIWYPKLSFSEELLAWWQGHAHKLISQKNCNNIRILICTKKKFAKKNCSALLAILSPTFMNEIRTDMPIPGAPLPPTAIANKKDDASLHGKCSTDFHLSSLSSLTTKWNSAGLKMNSAGSLYTRGVFLW